MLDPKVNTITKHISKLQTRNHYITANKITIKQRFCDYGFVRVSIINNCEQIHTVNHFECISIKL